MKSENVTFGASLLFIHFDFDHLNLLRLYRLRFGSLVFIDQIWLHLSITYVFIPYQGFILNVLRDPIKAKKIKTERGGTGHLFLSPLYCSYRTHREHFCRRVSAPPHTHTYTPQRGPWMWHLRMRLQSWSSGECEVPLYCLRSQVHSDPEV